MEKTPKLNWKGIRSQWEECPLDLQVCFLSEADTWEKSWKTWVCVSIDQHLKELQYWSVDRLYYCTRLIYQLSTIFYLLKITVAMERVCLYQETTGACLIEIKIINVMHYCSWVFLLSKSFSSMFHLGQFLPSILNAHSLWASSAGKDKYHWHTAEISACLLSTCRWFCLLLCQRPQSPSHTYVYAIYAGNTQDVCKSCLIWPIY